MKYGYGFIKFQTNIGDYRNCYLLHMYIHVHCVLVGDIYPDWAFDAVRYFGFDKS